MTHFTEYEKWCPNCKFKDNKETDDPCFDCLAEPAKEEGHQPVNYVAKQPDNFCQTCKFGSQSEDQYPCYECNGVIDPKTKKPKYYDPTKPQKKKERYGRKEKTNARLH